MRYKKKNFPKDISDERIGAGGYVKILTAPATATVSIKLFSIDNDPIYLDPDESLEFQHADDVYVTVQNLLPGETIEIILADGKFKISSDSENSIVGSYDVNAVDQLDKIMNPYQPPIVTIAGNETSTKTTILNIASLTSDKIRIKSAIHRDSGGAYNVLEIYLNGVRISECQSYLHVNGWLSVLNDSFEIENVKGKSLSIDSTFGGFVLEEFTLKA